MSDGSILEKVLESRQLKNIGKFQPYEILNNLFDILQPREQEVLRRRFQLLVKATGKKETLETIGQDLHITRERVRQIETEAIGKLREHSHRLESGSLIQILSDVVESILSRHGGIMEERHLIGELNQISLYQESADPVLSFLLHYLLDTNFEYMKESDSLFALWKKPQESLEFFHLVHEGAKEHIHEEKRPFPLPELFLVLERRIQEKNIEHDFSKDVLLAFLHLSKHLRPNVFEEWGFAHWPLIRPRHMNDKIYIILMRHQAPLHFRLIAEKINAAGFDKRQAYPATIHNELILDDKYVLVGKGIYALREWGYEKGTVVDVISGILQSEGSLSKETIIEKVLKKRMVKRTTILLALMNKERFKRNEQGEYELISHANKHYL